VSLDDVILKTDSSTYQDSNRIVLLLRNESETDVGYNLCLSDLEILRENDWIDARIPGHECDLYMDVVPPSGESGYDFEFQEPLPPGEYRMCTDYRRMISKVEELKEGACTAVFTVL
jgi:hypothetical protein